jgi:predicted dehydrogenase
MKAFIFLLTFLALTVGAIAQPLRVAVAGTTHGHVSWILNKKERKDIVLVGIYEPDKERWKKHIKNFGLAENLFYSDLNQMLNAVKPEAVVAFGSIYEHLAVVEACAPKKIHVMVEKPLAVSVQHAERMEALAKKNGIHLLTNYETSWYPTTEKSYQLVVDSNYVGKIRKTVFHHGHEGPKEIGVSNEFFNWLTDPVQNGGGALIDFGCYGANISTYLMGSVKPVSVTAVTNTFKPAIYPKVDDEATIIVEYPGAHAIIQASWNWPYSRKDMEIYGQTGYIISPDRNTMRLKNRNAKEERIEKIDQKASGAYEDPFSYFADVIRKKIIVPEYGLYSLSNNVMVVRILEAARESAQSGRRVTIE